MFLHHPQISKWILDPLESFHWEFLQWEFRNKFPQFVHKKSVDLEAFIWIFHEEYPTFFQLNGDNLWKIPGILGLMFSGKSCSQKLSLLLDLANPKLFPNVPEGINTGMGIISSQARSPYLWIGKIKIPCFHGRGDAQVEKVNWA